MGADPRFSLYNRDWKAARERVALLAALRHRRIFNALHDHIEEGWTIIPPLQLAADRIMYGRALRWPSAVTVAEFITSDPTDLFRGVAPGCTAAVPGGNSLIRRAFNPDDVIHESAEVLRHLRLLRLASIHPEFPSEIADLVGESCAEMERWCENLPEVLSPVDELVGAGRPNLFAAGSVRAVE